jgi:hypothetical protein
MCSDKVINFPVTSIGWGKFETLNTRKIHMIDAVVFGKLHDIVEA